jgi:hypothetical protein
MPLDDETPEIIERLELQYDFNELKRRMRRLLALVEAVSAVPDNLTTRQVTPDEARATIADAERAAHRLDDQLRFLVPRVLEALHVVVGYSPDDALPW